MRFAVIAVAAAAWAIAVAAGCGGGVGTGVFDESECDFTVTAGDGEQPAYAWESGDALTLTVARTDTLDVIVWGVITPGADGLVSPITHGRRPADAIETAAVERTLEPGVEYRVFVARSDGARCATRFDASQSQ